MDSSETQTTLGQAKHRKKKKKHTKNTTPHTKLNDEQLNPHNNN